MIGLAFALLLLLLLGVPTVLALPRAERPLRAYESLCLAWAFGLTNLVAGLALTSALGLSVGMWSGLVALAWLPIAAWRRRTQPISSFVPVREEIPWSRLDLTLVTLVVLLLGLTLLDAHHRPISGGDPVGLWASKGVAILHEGAIDYDGLDWKDSRSLGYPPLFPTACAFVAGHTGGYSSAWMRWLFPTFLALGLGFLTVCGAGSTPRRARILAALLLVTCPVVLSQATMGFADLPLAVFVAGSLVYLHGWVRAGEWRSLWVALLLAAAASLIRLEGTPFFALVVLVGMLFSGNLRRGAWVLGLAAVFFLVTNGPWFWIKTSHEYLVIVASEPPPEVAAPFAHLELAWRRVHVIVTKLGAEMFTLSRWGLLWPLAIALALLRPARLLRAPNLALLVTLVLFALAHVGALYFNAMATDRLPLQEPPTYAHRAVLHLLPAAAVWVLGLWAAREPTSSVPPA